jgi:type II restriction/modification system DNA methylase subunit YeeA
MELHLLLESAGVKTKLDKFHAKLQKLEFFDPACGCGNFLVIAYREIRLLEEVTLGELEKLTNQRRDPVCDVDQFYGIEIDSTSAQIAIVAMWITDHQMNCRISNNGKPYLRLPLNHRANIVCANALQIDWQRVVKPKKCSFIMGNPPFVGAKMMNDAQRADIAPIFGKLKNGGLLDYVAAWHVKATEFIKNNPKDTCRFRFDKQHLSRRTSWCFMVAFDGARCKNQLCTSYISLE